MVYHFHVLTHTYLHRRTWMARFAALEVCVATKYQTAHTTILIHMHGAGKRTEHGGLKSSELQILEVDCCWTPGCYAVKMFNQNEKLQKNGSNSEEHLHHHRLHPKKTVCMNGCSRDKRLFICIIITLRKRFDLEKIS